MNCILYHYLLHVHEERCEDLAYVDDLTLYRVSRLVVLSILQGKLCTFDWEEPVRLNTRRHIQSKHYHFYPEPLLILRDYPLRLLQIYLHALNSHNLCVWKKYKIILYIFWVIFAWVNRIKIMHSVSQLPHQPLNSRQFCQLWTLIIQNSLLFLWWLKLHKTTNRSNTPAVAANTEADRPAQLHAPPLHGARPRVVARE